jgi:hypothetical protein
MGKPTHFVMEQAMMLSIEKRAETTVLCHDRILEP